MIDIQILTQQTMKMNILYQNIQNPKNKAKNTRIISNTGSSEPDYEPSVLKHTKSKDASNKQKKKLRKTPKADTGSSNNDCEPIVLKHTKSKDASNKQEKKVENKTRYRVIQN